MPAVIIAVTNGNKILLSKYANREYTRYALLAGFTEIGESVDRETGSHGRSRITR